MKITEITNCPNCNGNGRLGYYKSKKGKITRIITGLGFDQIPYIIKFNEKEYFKKHLKLFTVPTKKCSKCKGKGEIKKRYYKIKGIVIYNTKIRGWKKIK